MIIETKRLIIQPAEVTDENIEFILQLWTNPEVMKFVGFPYGLKINKSQIKEQLESEQGKVFDRVILVRRKNDNKLIGNCKLGSIDEEGIAHTDVKVMPKFWGNGYGKEIKKALIEYQFTHTDCLGVQGDPNKLNIASIKMQEAVGGKKVREEIYKFPESMKEYTVDVECVVYIVYRSDWEKKK